MDENAKLALFTALGVASKSLFDFLRNRGQNQFDREAQLWKKLGELDQQCKDMRTRIDVLEAELNAEKMENMRLKNEVDDERAFQGKPAKYTATT
jgi:regulator of replication initiation timing